MPESLEATLDLDYGEAIAGADALAAAIEQAMAEGAAAGVASAADALSGVQAADVEIPVTADVGAAEAEIQGLAGTGTEVEVPVQADTGGAAEDISGLSNTEVTVAVEADTSDAQAELEQLGESGGAASESLNTLSGAGEESQGSLSGVTAASVAAGAGLGNVGGHALTAAAGIGAASFGFHELFEEGVTAATGTERLAQAAGNLASSVQKVQVGNLNTTMAELGHQFGSTGAEMDAAAAKAINFATAGGYSRAQAVSFAQGISALSARAVALNPSLGSVAEVADSMSTSFGRVILAAKKYNLSLSTAEVASRALANTGKTATNQLTIQDKAFAAVQISSERYGDTLAQKIAAGADLAANKQKSLIATGKELLETLGRPIAEGTISGLERLQGPVEALIKGFSALPGPVQEAAAAMIAFGVVSHFVGGSALENVGNFARFAGNNIRGIGVAAGVAGLAIGVMGVASDNTAEAIGGFALAGAGLGTAVLPGIGTAVGAAAGAVVGFGAAFLHARDTTEGFNAAQEKLNQTVTSGSIPSIILAADAVQRTSHAHAENINRLAEEHDATQRAVVGQYAYAGALDRVNEKQQTTAALSEGFTTALRKSPEAALTTIAAYDKLGISTDLYKDKLTASVRATQLAQQSQAQLATAASPLKVSFEEAATAVGGETDHLFQIGAAGSQALDSLSKLGPAQEKFTQAVASGNASQIEQAANTQATVVAQDAYNQRLLETGSATQAAQEKSDVFRSTLRDLLSQIPAESPAHAAIQKILDDMDNLAAHPATIDLKVEGGQAALQLASINKAIDDIIKHPQENPVKIFLDDTQATAKLDGINQARQILSRDPTQFQVVMEDLATGNIQDLQARLDSILAERHEVRVDSNVDSARSNITLLQSEINNVKGTVHVEGDATGAHKATDDAKVHADTTTGKITIDGSPELAKGAVEGAKAYADVTTGKITIGGDAAPANSVIVGTVATANGSTGVVIIDGNRGPFDAQVPKGKVGDSYVDINGNEVFKRGNYGKIGDAYIEVTSIPGASGVYGTSTHGTATGGVVGAGHLQFPGYASGGSPDTMVITVGEHGPENVELPAGSRVTTTGASRADNQRGWWGGGAMLEIDSSALDAAATRMLTAAETLIIATGLRPQPSRAALARRMI